MGARAARWELCRSDDGQFWVRFRSSNGNVIVSSETYKRKRDALRAAAITADSDVHKSAAGTYVWSGHRRIFIRDLTVKP